MKIEVIEDKRLLRILSKIKSISEADLIHIMGKAYIDTPGYCHRERANYFNVADCMKENMGDSSFNKLLKWIHANPKKVDMIMKFK